MLKHNRTGNSVSRQRSQRLKQQRRRSLGLESLENRSMLALVTQLVGDLNTDVLLGDSNPRNFTDVGGTTFFVARSSSAGVELWRTDGSSGGTRRVLDIFGGPGDSSPNNLVNVGGTLFFSAGSLAEGYELWKSDGTESGTVLVKDIEPGSSSSFPTNLINLNGTLVFTASDTNGGRELWTSDGTEAGTNQLLDIIAGGTGSNPSYLVNAGGTIFFQASDFTNGRELWKTDGTDVGTVLVSDINPGINSSGPQNLINLNGFVYFSAKDATDGYELWKSDGTSFGTVQVQDINVGTYGSYVSNPVVANGLLYFFAQDAATGTELWQSDGTSDGTISVLDINPGINSSSPSGLINVGGILYFSANDGTSGSELWRSNGTDRGTLQVKDINPGSGSSIISNLIEFNGNLLFSASDGTTGNELWKSDGSTTGTVPVSDINVGPNGSFPRELKNVSGTVYFSARNSTDGYEVWKTDGTAVGTLQVRDIFTGSQGSYPRYLTPLNGSVYFSAKNASGYELWKSDGSVAGTAVVKDIAAGAASSSPSQFLTIANTLYFRANDGTGGVELWKSDGTTAGTTLVKDINTGALGSNPSNLVNLNGVLYFSASSTGSGEELWKSDGTAAGTEQVSDLLDGPDSSRPRNLFNFNGELYFSASDGSAGYELWKSDGTEGGTVQVLDINAGLFSSYPGNFTNVNGTLFFTASNADGYELWTTDGTALGTVRLKDINAGPGSSSPSQLQNIGGVLYFVANDNLNGYELWKSDGTVDGTVLVEDINPGLANGFPSQLTNVNGTVFFAATNPGAGTELWKYDGTLASLVFDIRGGALGSNPSSLINHLGTLYFNAADSRGYELWKSDGTTLGTVLFSDINPGALSSSPSQLTSLGDQLFFAADTEATKVELWRVADIDLPPEITSGSGNISASYSVVENTKFVTGVTATDDNGPAGITFSISGGADANLFTINPTAGTVNFKANPDFENPTDADTNNVYVVVVKVTDASSNFDTQTLNISVTNSSVPTTTVGLNAAGSVTFLDASTKINLITISRVGTNYVISDASTDPDQIISASSLPGAVVSPDLKSVTIPESLITGTGKPLVIDVAGGNDSVFLDTDQTAGDIVPDSGLTISLGTGVDTLDVVDSTTTNTWTFSGAQNGTLLLTTLGTITFSGIENAFGGSGADTFRFNATGANTVRSINGFSAADLTPSSLDAIEITRNANFILTNTKLVVDALAVGQQDQTFTFAGIKRAFLNGTAGTDSFDVSGWTSRGANAAASNFGGKIDGGGGNDTLVKSGSLASFVVTDTQISTGDLMVLQLANLEQANLRQTGAAAVAFTMSGWTKNASLTGGSGNDRIVYSSDFTSLSLSDTSLAVNATQTMTLASIENANLTGGASANRVTLSNFGMTGKTTFNGLTGLDQIEVSRDADFILSNGFLKAGTYSVTLAAVESFKATGGDAVNTFNISAWTGSGAIEGGGPATSGSDQVIATFNGDMALAPTSLTINAPGSAVKRTITLSGVEDAALTGGAGNNAFTLSEWPSEATLNGGAGTGDTLTIVRNRNFVLESGKATVDGQLNTFAAFESLTATGGAGNNSFSLLPGFNTGLTSVAIKPAAGAADIIDLQVGGNVTVTQTGAASAAIAVTGGPTLNFGTGDIPEVIRLAGTKAGLTYAFVNYNGSGAVTGKTGANTVSFSKAGNYTLSGTALKAGTKNFALTNVTAVNLTGGAGNESFTVNGWTRALTINGAAGNDTLALTTNAATVSLKDTAVTQTGATAWKLSAVEVGRITGGAANQTFNVTGWTQGGAVIGSGGTDRLIASENADMILSNTGFTHNGKFFTLGSVEAATLTGGAGNNFFNASTFTGSVTLSGLGGNDVLLGGKAADVINGGDGNDWLGGNAGNDQLLGGKDNDILVGGDGIDTLNNASSVTGDDILIGGRTNYDSSKTAIDAIVARWVVKTSFSAGVNDLKTGFKVGAATYRLNTTTVFDDDVTDILLGGAGNDWFLADIAPASTTGLENPDDSAVEAPLILDL